MKPKAIIVILILVWAGSALAAQKADFYVAPDGNDNAAGTLEEPFATLSRARDAIRESKKNQPNRDYRVLLRGGVYRITQTVVFSLPDSAAPGQTITYAAYPGETPVLTAGVPITGWERTDIAQGNVWSAPQPDGLKAFSTLFNGNKRLSRARDKGFTSPAESKQWRSDDQTVFRFPKGAMKNWPDLHNAELVLVTAAPWTMNILPIASVDEEAMTARTAIPGTYALSRPRFGEFPESAWIENIMESLDEPGEWLLDKKEQRIYIWPEEDRPDSGITAPALTEIIRIEGKIDYDGPQDNPVRGVRFVGLTFTQADRFTWQQNRIGWGVQHDWEMFDRPTAMVRLRGAENCGIVDCHLMNSGAAGIRLDLHCQKNMISNNKLEHLGGVGILLCGYGPGTKDVNRENRVTGNHIHHVGEIYWHSPAVFVWQSGHNLIGNNLIHNTPYTGIVVSGRIGWDRTGKAECSRTVRWKEIDSILDPQGPRDWYTREPFLHGRKNHIFRNEIHHVMEVMTDGNGIYISGTGRENVVSENFIHDCPNKQFAEGIRCDDDQNETIIQRNIIWRLGGLATYVTIKGMNHVRNNIFACPLTPPRRGMLSLELTRNASLAGAEIQRNIFYSNCKDDKICAQGRSYYGTYCYLRDAMTDYNLYHNTEDAEWGQRHLAAERKHQSELHSRSGDPLFVNPDQGDFRLKPDSPALQLGFDPIDMNKIGLK